MWVPAFSSASEKNAQTLQDNKTGRVIEGERKSIYASLRAKYVLQNSVIVKCIDRGQLNLLSRECITNGVVQTVSLLISIISVL